MGYAFYAVLGSLPQIAAAACIPVAATIAVCFVVKSLRLRRQSGGGHAGLD
jgi:hypothetical protein